MWCDISFYAKSGTYVLDTVSLQLRLSEVILARFGNKAKCAQRFASHWMNASNAFMKQLRLSKLVN
jgi:hypothetical protein